VRSKRIVTVSSLAKAFGAPLAVLASSGPLVARVRRCGGTRVASSPAAIPIVVAAQRALEINDADGDRLRRRLLRLVAAFRTGLGACALQRSRRPRRTAPSSGSFFPVQHVAFASPREARAFHEALEQRGVRTVLTRSRTEAATRTTFVFTARHRLEDVERALGAVRAVTLELASGRRA
jgi:8-amino-7-oxononanoate synthase